MNRRRLLTLVGVAITAVSLYVALRGIHLGDVVGHLGEIGVWWAVPIAGSTLLSIWIRAVRWKLMLEPIGKVTIAKSFSATMIGFMANNILPMRLGELVRAYSIGKNSGVSKSSAFATIVVERAFDLLALLLFLAVMLLRYPFADWIKLAGYIAFAGLLGMAAVMVFLRWKREATLRLFRRLVRPFPAGMQEQIEGLLLRFVDGLEVLARGHHLLLVTLLSFATWLAVSLSFFFTALALRLHDLPADASIVMVVVTALAVMVPSSPGFVGTFELGVRAGLELFGVSGEVAITYAVFNHIVQFVPVTLLGLYFLWRENFSLSRAVEQDDAAEV